MVYKAHISLEIIMLVNIFVVICGFQLPFSTVNVTTVP